MYWETNAIRESVGLGKAIGAQHWRLWEWFNGHVDRFLSNRPVFQPSSLKELWQFVLSGKAQESDYVDLKANGATGTYWRLQEWVPRAPGQLWSQDDLMRFSPDEISMIIQGDYTAPEHLRKFSGFGFYGNREHWEGRFVSSASSKQSLQQQGFGYRLGCFRPALTGDENRHALLGLCTAKESLVDLAFPVVVSPEVYLKFARARDIDRHAVEIEGRLRITGVKPSEPFSSFLQAAAASVDDPIKSMIASPTGVPAMVGQIVSPLDFNALRHDAHPLVTLRVDGWNIDEESRSRGILMLCRNSVIDPADRMIEQLEQKQGEILDSLRYSIEFLTGSDYQVGTTMSPVTDFDGRVQRFQAQTWVGVNPAQDAKVISGVSDPLLPPDKASKP